jgi:hypothetical protein
VGEARVVEGVLLVLLVLLVFLVMVVVVVLVLLLLLLLLLHGGLWVAGFCAWGGWLLVVVGCRWGWVSLTGVVVGVGMGGLDNLGIRAGCIGTGTGICV